MGLGEREAEEMRRPFLAMVICLDRVCGNCGEGMGSFLLGGVEWLPSLMGRVCSGSTGLFFKQQKVY